VTATVQEAQADLRGLLGRLAPGEELTPTDDGHEVATVRAKAAPPAGKRVPGLWQGKAAILSEDDDHLADFAEHTGAI
jgi:antitoxin (DNA-binding transcriptional repressor) of toxin-antitoxin stability system